MTAPAIPSVAWTRIAGIAVGTTCRTSTRGVVAPSARAACTYSNSRAQNLPPDKPRKPNPSDDRQREQRIREARPEHRHKRNRQQQTWKCQQDVRNPADHVIDPAAEVASDGAEQSPHDRRHPNDDDSEQKRDAAADEDAREHVAPEFVEAERMRRRRTDEPQRQLLSGGIDPYHRRPGERQERDDNDDGRPDFQEHAASLLIANPGVEESVRDVGQKIHHHIRRRNQQNASLHQRVVAKSD